MAPQPDDDDVDLGISLATVATIVEHARAVQAMAEGEADEFDDEDGSEPAGLADHDDLTEESLVAFIDELNEDEQAALIALAWVGRGDYGPEEWDEALRLAAERNTGRDAGQYLVDMDLVGDLLAEGVAAFGLSVEDV
jgi:hypothetical protein